jgi:hypothetical protein
MADYSVAKSGTAQDLMLVVVRNYEDYLKRTGLVLPTKGRLGRALLQPPLVAMGRLIAHILEILPADLVMNIHEKVYSALSAPYRFEFNGSSPELLKARQLVEQLTRECGRRPALLGVLSHASTTGEEGHLNFELVRQASLALQQLRRESPGQKSGSRPRLLIAVDPFALDTAPHHQEALYSGTMGTYHIGLDRMSLNRSFLGRHLLSPARWDRVIYRLNRSLRDGGEVALVLAGGVPLTTRLLYTAREWVRRCCRESPRNADSAAIFSDLEKDSLYRNFKEKNPTESAPSVVRVLQGWAMAALAESDAETGQISDQDRIILQRILDILGFPKDQASRHLSSFAEEFARETPYRERLFNILAARVVGRGRPIVFVPVVHKTQGGFSVKINDAWGWKKFEHGKISSLVPSASGFEAWEGTPSDFADIFGRRNFV